VKSRIVFKIEKLTKAELISKARNEKPKLISSLNGNSHVVCRPIIATHIVNYENYYTA